MIDDAFGNSNQVLNVGQLRFIGEEIKDLRGALTEVSSLPHYAGSADGSIKPNESALGYFDIVSDKIDGFQRRLVVEVDKQYQAITTGTLTATPTEPAATVITTTVVDPDPVANASTTQVMPPLKTRPVRTAPARPVRSSGKPGVRGRFVALGVVALAVVVGATTNWFGLRSNDSTPTTTTTEPAVAPTTTAIQSTTTVENTTTTLAETTTTTEPAAPTTSTVAAVPDTTATTVDIAAGTPAAGNGTHTATTIAAVRSSRRATATTVDPAEAAKRQAYINAHMNPTPAGPMVTTTVVGQSVAG